MMAGINKVSNPLEEVVTMMRQIELFKYIVKKEELPFKITGMRLHNTTAEFVKEHTPSDFKFDEDLHMLPVNDEEPDGFIVESTKN